MAVCLYSLNDIHSILWVAGSTIQSQHRDLSVMGAACSARGTAGVIWFDALQPLTEILTIPQVSNTQSHTARNRCMLRKHQINESCGKVTLLR